MDLRRGCGNLPKDLFKIVKTWINSGGKRKVLEVTGVWG